MTAWQDFMFVLAFYRGEVFAEWYEHALARGWAHGSELVIALGSPRGERPGMTDNVYGAERLLKAAVAIGLLSRSSRPTPTREQQFFDVNKSLHFSPESAWVAYGYEPRELYLTAAPR